MTGQDFVSPFAWGLQLHLFLFLSCQNNNGPQVEGKEQFWLIERIHPSLPEPPKTAINEQPNTYRHRRRGIRKVYMIWSIEL